METIVLPASIEQLSIIRQIIADNLPSNYKSVQLKIELAVEELLTNICNHAYKGTEGKATFICSEIDFDNSSFFLVKISDFGPSYDPFKEAGVPDTISDVNNRPIGGVGIYLVKQVAAHYMYSRLDNQNVIQLLFASE